MMGKSLLPRAVQNVRDVRELGLPVLRRHLGRWHGDGCGEVAIEGMGTVCVRHGESDFLTVRQVFIDRDYDFAVVPELAARIQRRYRQILAAGGVPIIADIGANIGAASLWFHREFPEAAIVAVEPDPGNYAILARNVSGNPQIVAQEAASGAEPGFVTLHSAAGEGWAVQTERSGSGVPVITVDDAWQASGGDTPFIVKIDIEGFEADLFAGNLGWIDETYVVIVEPHDWMLPGEFSSRGFQKALAEHDFELFIHGENLIYSRS